MGPRVTWPQEPLLYIAVPLGITPQLVQSCGTRAEVSTELWDGSAWGMESCKLAIKGKCGLIGLMDCDHQFHGSHCSPPHAEVHFSTRLSLSREAGRRFLKLCLPPQGENVFFVVTNLIVTPNQRQGICAEV